MKRIIFFFLIWTLYSSHAEVYSQDCTKIGVVEDDGSCTTLYWITMGQVSGGTGTISDPAVGDGIQQNVLYSNSTQINCNFLEGAITHQNHFVKFGFGSNCLPHVLQPFWRFRRSFSNGTFISEFIAGPWLIFEPECAWVNPCKRQIRFMEN